MITDKFRKRAVFFIYSLRKQKIGSLYERYQKEIRCGIPPDTLRLNLIRLLQHCEKNVPYYQNIMKKLGDSYQNDPFDYLKQMPILTKEIINSHFDELKSRDLSNRKWYVNTTGGSTGEPVKFIQDREFDTLSSPITSIMSWLTGTDLGERVVMLWGSMHDLEGAEENWKTKFLGWLMNTRFMSVYHLESATMREYLETLNQNPPNLIIGYTNALNEIAKYAEKSGIDVHKQNAIISSAGTLYPEIRDTIERVFQCKVYDRYGSREMGNIACERPGYTGLWVPPWGNFVEAVDSNGVMVPDGVEGDLLITSFCNYAMPFIRYQIGDRGILTMPDKSNHPEVCQVLKRLTGRNIETYYNINGEVIDASHFMPILYHLYWIHKYQVVQKGPSCITFRIVKSVEQPPEKDIEQIIHLSRRVMHDDTCQIIFEYVNEILVNHSGKYNYIINEMNTN